MQLDIFNQPVPPPPVFPTSARQVTKRDQQRLSGQCRQMLDVLRAGPSTNQRLAEIALKYTSRISDLRLVGYVITCDRVGDGITRYTLVSEPGK